MSYNDVEVSNIVVSGNVSVELDIEQLPELDANGWSIEFKDVRPLGTELKYKDYPTINCHGTGAYIIRSPSRDELREVNKAFVKLMYDKGIIDDIRDPEFSVKNVVGTITLDYEVNLLNFNRDNLLNSNYEPEQFPAVSFKPDEVDVNFNIFKSGKVVVQGADDEEELEKASRFIQDELEDYKIDSKYTDLLS